MQALEHIESIECRTGREVSSRPLGPQKVEPESRSESFVSVEPKSVPYVEPEKHSVPLWRWVLVWLEGGRLIRHVGPGFEPQERHEFESVEFLNPQGPGKWIV